MNHLNRNYSNSGKLHHLRRTSIGRVDETKSLGGDCMIGRKVGRGGSTLVVVGASQRGRGSRCLVVAGFAEGIAQPFQTLVKTITRGGASGLDVL
jgi:hypothetical protein